MTWNKFCLIFVHLCICTIELFYVIRLVHLFELNGYIIVDNAKDQQG